MQILTRITRKQWLMGGVALVLIASATGLGIWQIGLRQPVADPVIIARQVRGGDLPTDPWSSAWKKASAVVMPLSITSTPEATAKNVQVRALTDGTNLAIRMEWDDSSQEVRTLRPQDFADAAAVQLSGELSQVCMGQLDMAVHIWQWKADWQEGSREMTAQYPNMLVDGQFDGEGKPLALFGEDLFARPAYAAGNARAAVVKENPVEHLVAGGFGTLTPAGPHPMQGKGVWQKGKWAVVFVRPLVGDPGDVTLAAGRPLQAAFALWDGKLQQRNGMKYATNWAVLQVEASK